MQAYSLHFWIYSLPGTLPQAKTVEAYSLGYRAFCTIETGLISLLNYISINTHIFNLR